MIEVVSHPSNLADWDETSRDQPFYLELFGETKPLIEQNFAEALPAGAADGSLQTTAFTPVYEYWWTIGHSGATELEVLWSQLQDPAASIFVYFPTSWGWRIKELISTVKYLTPVHGQESLFQKVAKHWQEAAPIVSDVASLGSLLPNPALAEVARMMSTIAKLQINNVPQAEGYEWSVRKVTHKSEHGVMHGVKWTLPKKMFIELGDRLTGSVAVSFIPSQVQQVGVVLDEKPTFGQGTVLARAEIHIRDRNQPIYTPPAQQHQPKPFIELRIAPSLNAG